MKPFRKACSTESRTIHPYVPIRRHRLRFSEAVSWIVLAILLALSLLPFVMMLLLSLKTNADIPLSLPTLATIAIMTTLGIYNDYIWPLVTISDSSLQTFTVGVTRFAGEFNLDYGPTLAGYVIGSLPLLRCSR